MRARLGGDRHARASAAIESGRSLREAHAAVVASQPDHELPHLEALLRRAPARRPTLLPGAGRTTLRGIASERGVDWSSVQAALDDHARGSGGPQ